MKCENYFCIYQSDDECTIDEIHLDIIGQCTDCLYANIEKSISEEAKSRHWKNWNNKNQITIVIWFLFISCNMYNKQ